MNKTVAEALHASTRVSAARAMAKMASPLHEHGNHSVNSVDRPCCLMSYIASRQYFAICLRRLPCRAISGDRMRLLRRTQVSNLPRRRDGEQHNLTWNCGAEGPTNDGSVLDLRSRQVLT